MPICVPICAPICMSSAHKLPLRAIDADDFKYKKEEVPNQKYWAIVE